MQVDRLVPAQVPPVQAKVVAAGLQFAVRMEEPFGRIVVGAAVSVQIGTFEATP